MQTTCPRDRLSGLGAPPPREYREYRGLHAGEHILVCGCGSSLSRIVAPERLVTIGVNDVGRLFDPDYLVVLNPPSQFSRDRFQYIARSRAHAIFSQLDLGIDHPNLVRLKLGRKGGTDLSDPNLLPYTRNSPYPAICLAVHMGAHRVGVMGVDFTDNHFFAKTGPHSLANECAQIDREYQQLYASCLRHGVEVFNLSEESRLTAFPKMSQQEFMRSALRPSAVQNRSVFFVNYNFLSCGHVFSDGLANAADEIGLSHDSATWDDPQLPQKVSSFDPDLLFVVHGRKFSGRWRNEFSGRRSALWLLDEPYEVDDTCRFSSRFNAVFVNDPGTLSRHSGSHYLPVCYDPVTCTYVAGEKRQHAVGFIGGHNPQREEALARLAHKDMLTYVVGGPWQNPAVNDRCLSGNIPAGQTAQLYRSTRIVINLFRTRHHFNRAGIPAFSLNPRVYEGVGCGALVISEYRSELDTICPEMPTFRTLDEMEEQVDRYLHDEGLFAQTRKACIRRLATQTYSRRLSKVLSLALGDAEARMEQSTIPATARLTENHGESHSVIAGVSHAAEEQLCATQEATIRLDLPYELATEWEAFPDFVALSEGGCITLNRPLDPGPGGEQGLVGKVSYGNVLMEFEVYLHESTIFVAKLHQVEARNQLSNSYHMMCHGTHAYMARHNHVFCTFRLPVGRWVPISFSYCDGTIVVRRHGAEVGRVSDGDLRDGYSFLGVRNGTALLRNVRMQKAGSATTPRSDSEYEVLVGGSKQGTPTVSIITTVYDRLECLENCIRSVQALNFHDFEHIVVADCPPGNVIERMKNIVADYNRDYGKLTLLNLNKRKNDWGMSPAAVGLARACGRYVCFLSDDNGYTPNHFDKLLAALDENPGLGFAYSSCLYAGRSILNAAIPRYGNIDLGQPLIRREMFNKYFGGTIEFHEIAWDWRMVERLLRSGVRWRHISDATFIFRLAMYPELLPRGLGRSAISYCIACYRPAYVRRLIDDLIRKTSVQYEILLWLNVSDPEFEEFIASRTAAGVSIRVIGSSPENIGMAAYPHLFAASRSQMVVQIDDDVVCISPRIAETAREILDRFPQIGMLTADVWQDEYTSGARPPLKDYRIYDREFGLYDGPIDGWFAVYRKTSLDVCKQIQPSRYFYLGCAIKSRLATLGQVGLLCRRMRVFHVTDPPYVAHFGMLEAEVAKYRAIGRQDQAGAYLRANDRLPPREELSSRVQQIFESLAHVPQSTDA